MGVGLGVSVMQEEDDGHVRCRLAQRSGGAMLASAGALAAVLLAPGIVHAQSQEPNRSPARSARGAQIVYPRLPTGEAPKERWDRPFTLWIHLPPLGPFGVLGLSFDYSPVRWFAVEAGGGPNLDGLQGTLAARGRVPLTRGLALSAGPFAAVGNYDADDDCLGCVDREYRGPRRSWRPALVAGGLFSLEGRRENGFSWRVLAGSSRVLNESAVDCTPAEDETDCSAKDALWAGYLSVALGWTLD